MTKKPLRLSEMVKAAVVARQKSPKNWFDRLPEDAKAELLGVRSEWRAGVIESSAKRLAEDIVEQCRAAGVETCGVCGVREWLSKG